MVILALAMKKIRINELAKRRSEAHEILMAPTGVTEKKDSSLIGMKMWPGCAHYA
jgi:hypothetical protein